MSLRSIPVLAAVASLLGCGSEAEPTAIPRAVGQRIERRGEELAACGQLFHVGVPIVLWTDPGGYDAYRTVPRFEAAPRTTDGEIVHRPRFGVRQPRGDDVTARAGDGEIDWTLDALRRQVHQFVLHYDMCGTSRRCFQILQDKRNLSVHFLLDVDGTIYQTLDLAERAWHAGSANDGSIGVEIAHIGSYPQPGHTYMRWYQRDDDGLFVRFPKWLGDPGIRTPEFVARPDRDGVFEGVINGRTQYQYDFTTEQYRSLAALLATLHRIFPRIRLVAPTDPDGVVRPDTLPPAELAAFDGVVGHFHVKRGKSDPGPAMDWQRVLDEARELVR